MDSDTPSIRTLRRALVMLGSPEKLARALKCPVVRLQSWLAGAETPTTSAFILALAIVAKGRPPK
jgi:DNA-binding transcriptional regulator YiaG